jgi:hypothetical protein
LNDPKNSESDATDPREDGSCPYVIDVLMGPAHPMYRPWMECMLDDNEVVLAFLDRGKEIMTCHCDVARMMDRYWARVIWYAAVSDICIDLSYDLETKTFKDATNVKMPEKNEENE